MKIVIGLFLVLGLGLLTGAGVLWRKHATFAAHAVHADGVVTDLIYRRGSRGKGSTYVPEVQFTAPDGNVVRFTATTGSNPAAYDRGEHVSVMFQPNHPQGARIDSFGENWFGVLVLGSMGLFFTLFGASFIVSGVRTRAANRWLATNGLRVQARYEGVVSGNMKTHGRNSYRLRCQWQHPITHKVYIFNSERIWFDPAPYVKRDTVEVLVDMDNPKRYQVDISFLPEAG